MQTVESIVTLTPEDNRTLTNLARSKGKDEMAVLNELVARAIKDAVYRHKRNAQMWQEKKALKEKQADLVERARAAGIDVSAFE